MYYHFDNIHLDSLFSRISLVLLSDRGDPSRVIPLKKYIVCPSVIDHIKNENHHIKNIHNHSLLII